MVSKLQNDLSGLSILVSYFNKEDFLSQLFNCLIDSLKLNAKVYIIDDGSCQKSRTLLSKRIESVPSELKLNLFYFYQANLGSGGVRNLLIDRVKTPFFVFLDADDYLILDSLAKCLNWLKSSTAQALVAPFSKSENTLPFPIIDSPQLYQVQGVELYEAMGYWRIIYRRETFNYSEIRFVPGSNTGHFEKFILDDALFMIRFSSKISEVLLAPYYHVFYVYNPPAFTKESRANYRRQESLMPFANMKYTTQYNKDKVKILEIEKRMLWINLKSCYEDLGPKWKLRYFPRFASSIIYTQLFPLKKDSIYLIYKHLGSLLKILYRSTVINFAFRK